MVHVELSLSAPSTASEACRLYSVWFKVGEPLTWDGETGGEKGVFISSDGVTRRVIAEMEM